MKKVLGVIGAVLGVIALTTALGIGLYYWAIKDDIKFVDNHPGAVWVPIEDYTMVVEETKEVIIGADSIGNNQSGNNSNVYKPAEGSPNIIIINPQGGNSTATESSNEGKVDAGNNSPTTASKPASENVKPQSTTKQATQNTTISNQTYPDYAFTERAENTTTRKGIITKIESDHEGTYKGYSYTVYVKNDGTGDITITGYDPSYGTAITIPSSMENTNYSVKTIADYAFANKGLTSITLPNTLKTINAFAFAGNCHDGSLKVNIPGSVLSIGEAAFAGITVNNVPSLYTLDKGCIYRGDSIISASGAFSSYSLKSGTRHIASGAFYGCTRLESISGFGMLTDDGRNLGINSYAFYGCSSLTTVDKIPSAVQYLPEGSFAGCYSLKKLVMNYTPEFSKQLIYNGSALSDGTTLFVAGGSIQAN